MSSPIRFPLRHRLISFLRDLDVRGVRGLAHRLPYWIMPKPKSGMLMETLHGFPMYIDPVIDQGVERSMYYTGTYERGTMYLLDRVLGAGDCFVDVGANIGLMTVHAARLVGAHGRVFAFEPNPETHRLLKRNVELNELTNVTLSEQAVGAVASEGMLYDRWDSSRGSASMVADGHQRAGSKVHITTLDQTLSQVDKVRLIKLDIEGYEPQALQGASQLLGNDQAPMLIVECSTDVYPEHPQMLYGQLKSMNAFRFFKAMGGKERKSKFIEVLDESMLPLHDNLFVCLNVHLKTLPKDLFIKN